MENIRESFNFQNFMSSMVMMSGSVMAAAALVLLLFMLVTRRVLPYYAKFTLFIVISAISATICIPFMFLRPRHWKNALFPAAGSRFSAWLLGLKYEVRGLEKVTPDSGGIILLNHQSGLDLIILAQIWPRVERCTVISKKEVFYLGPFGLATWLWGTIFIDKLNGPKAKETINRTGQIIKKNKFRLIMFPEGTRHDGPELLPFKKGAFHVAIDAQVPIQPVVVSRYHFLDSDQKKFGTGKVVMEFLDPIPTEGKSRDNIEKIVDQTYEAMNNRYVLLSAETKPLCQNHQANSNNKLKVT